MFLNNNYYIPRELVNTIITYNMPYLTDIKKLNIKQHFSNIKKIRQRQVKIQKRIIEEFEEEVASSEYELLSPEEQIYFIRKNNRIYEKYWLLLNIVN